jgi:ABC-type polysaccharide/polyol phosphate transport system ATPase subunit
MVAISVKNVAKHYYLGRPQTGRSLRQVVESWITAPARLVKSSLSPRQKPVDRPSIWALRDIDFEVGKGEVLGIIGKNGSGKSTLLKLISRLSRPTRGRIEVFGRVGSLLEVGVGFNPELSGRENIYLNGAIIGMSTAEMDSKFHAIVQFAGLEDFIATAVKHYSSGMYMRLAFSVAAHLDPDILLLDEILAVGDLDFQRRCMKKVSQFRDQGKTILIVSHSMSPITDLCTRALWLDRGRLAAIGSPRKVVQHYLRKDPNIELGVEVTPALELIEKDPEPEKNKSHPSAAPSLPDTSASNEQTIIQEEESSRIDNLAEPEKTPDTAESNQNSKRQLEDSRPAVDGHIEAGEESREDVDGELPWGRVTYIPPVGTHGVHVDEAYIQLNDQTGLGKIPYERSYQLIIHYEVPEKIVGLRIGYKFYNERDQVILHAVTNDPVDDPQNVGDPGRRKTTVEVPGALLAPGTFDVEIGIWSPLIGHHMSENAYRFEIVNPTVCSIGMEVLRPILAWEVE